MNTIDTLLSRAAVGFDRTLSKQEIVLDQRLENTNISNSTKQDQTPVRDIESISSNWNSMSHDERNRYLYG